MVRTILSGALILLSLPAQAETPTEWIELGARVHGAFGAFMDETPTHNCMQRYHFSQAICPLFIQKGRDPIKERGLGDSKRSSGEPALGFSVHIR
jgi:hypothetical protein